MDVANLNVGSGAEVIVLAQSPLSRAYYAAGEPPATCWSMHGVTPEDMAPSDSGEVPTQKQAERCLICDKSVRGSGAQSGTACKYEQRLAVVLPGDPSTVYRLHLNPGSIFGKGGASAMPWIAYLRYLDSRHTDFKQVVTHVQPDMRGDRTKFSFRPVAHMSEETLGRILGKVSDHIPEALKFTVPPAAHNPFGVTEGFSLDDSE